MRKSNLDRETQKDLHIESDKVEKGIKTQRTANLRAHTQCWEGHWSAHLASRSGERTQMTKGRGAYQST